MIKKPVILLPFTIVAFFEGLALELIYFSNRRPLSLITAPLIRKFSGEVFLHYPMNLVKIPKYFYYAQLLIYVFLGIFMAAIVVNIVKNIKSELPLKTGAILKNALRKYASFIVFGALMLCVIFMLRSADGFIFQKLTGLISKNFQQAFPRIYAFAITLFYFITSLIMQALFICVIPLMVVEGKPLLKAVTGSVRFGARNFLSVLFLIFLPYFLYFPVTLMKAYAPDFGSKMFPETVLWILAFGVVVAVFIDAFVMACATIILMERNKS